MLVKNNSGPIKYTIDQSISAEIITLITNFFSFLMATMFN